MLNNFRGFYIYILAPTSGHSHASTLATSGGGPEVLWTNRVSSLEQNKQYKTSGKQRKNFTSGSLKKYHSESRMDNLRGTKHTNASSYSVVKHGNHMTMAEPIKSELTDKSQDSNPPVRHTVYTEDGQRLSVDINLKVLSPTPGQQTLQQTGQGNVRPIGPITQLKHISAVHQPAQIPLNPTAHPYQPQNYVPVQGQPLLQDYGPIFSQPPLQDVQQQQLAYYSGAPNIYQHSGQPLQVDAWTHVHTGHTQPQVTTYYILNNNIYHI